MGDVSEQNESSRPSLDTEAVSGDDEISTYEEVKLDYAMLSKDVLNPPTIPKTLPSDTIDQVIAALTNVPDVSLGSDSPRKSSSSRNIQQSSSSNADGGRHKRSRSHREEISSDEDDHYKRRRDHYEDEENVQIIKKIPISALRGRGRGRLRIRARGRGRGFLQEQARGLFAPRVARAKQIRDREREYHNSQPTSVSRGGFPVARGRNIFPEDEVAGGSGRGRGVQRENALFKRFKQQHRLEEDKEEDEYYASRKTRSRTRSRSRSHSRSRSDSSSNSSDSQSSSGSDSDDSPRKRKKKKEKKKKRKHKKDKKKKKIKEEKVESEERDSDWRIQLLQKMKNIKNLPPEQLEVEFKKAMAEKKRKEEEEKCIEQIKMRQKLARKVKKESEKAAKNAAKEKKVKRESEENFYAGFNEAAIKMEEEERPRIKTEEEEDAPTTYPAIFKPSFAEVPFQEQTGDPMDTPLPEGAGEDQFKPRTSQSHTEEDDPYARAFEENMNRSRKSEPSEVSWPAGALEASGLEDTQLTKEQMDLLQDQQRLAMDDKSKNVVSASKMFSKIRNRIKNKGPMKINLKTHSMNDDPGLEGGAGENTPGEGLSDGENWPEEDQDSNQYLMNNENEDLNIAKRMERMRRKKEAHDPGELEDGEHSPSPEPERPHLRRKRLQKPGTRGSTPLMDEEKPVVEEREEGEIDPDAPTTSGPTAIVASNWPPQQVPPAPVGPAVNFIDTSVPPPNLLGPGGPGGPGGPPPRHIPPRPMVVHPPRPLMGSTIPPPARLPVPVRPGPQRPPMLNEPFHGNGPPTYLPPPHMAGIPPPVSSVHPIGVHQAPPPTHVPPPLSDPFVSSSSSKDQFPRRSAEHDRYGPRKYEDYDKRRDDRYDRRDDRYDRSDDRYDRHRSSRHDRRDRRDDRDDRDRRGDYDDRGRRSRRSDDRTDEYSRYQSENKVFGGEDISEDEEGDGGFDINKNITPIMKYIAKHLEEKRHTLELRGPFRYNDNMPGLSKHLFVSHTIVTLLEKAGYDQSKMYMQSMFPNGMSQIKEEMLDQAAKGKLHPEIFGNKIVRMVSRCIKCYIAYFSGKKEDLASSSEDEDTGSRETRTVNTSLSAILGMIKEDAATESRSARESEERNPTSKIPDTISTNPWGNMDTKIKAEHLKSFSQLQNHFTKQLMGRGVHQRDAREESANCMMCLVVTGWSDDMLKDMVSRFKRTILPEQSQLDEKRTGANRTLFDQMVDLMNRHKQQFPAAIHEAAQREDDPEEAMSKRIKNIVERMLKFYMKGCGKLQEGREATASQQPQAAPNDYQYNYLPEGLREDEKSAGTGKDMSASNKTPNFFNMDAAAVANRSFSSYNNVKRMSIDEDETNPDFEPVSPDNGEIVKGGLSKQKYLIGSLAVDTLQFKGVSYVYEISVHMSDTSSQEIFVLPTNLKNDKTVLEMLGFQYNPEDKKFMYVKPGGNMSKVHGERQALEKLVQFLQEKRYESKGDSKNTGLVLVTQTTGELATWERFTRFHKVDMEIDSVVAGYGVLDYFVEDSGGLFSYVGPKMNRESNKTYFTWEYSAQGRESENMASTRASAVLILLEDLLGAPPDYENFIKHNCFKNDETRMNEVHRKEDIIKDLYALECQLCDALNDRNQRKKIFTGGIFSPSSAAEWGDKAGFVAAKFIRFLVESGLSKPALKDKAVHAREKGIPFQVNLQPIIKRMKKEDERERCRQQIDNLVRVTQDFILTK